MDREQSPPPETSPEDETRDPKIAAHPMYTQQPRAAFAPKYINPGPPTQGEKPSEEFFILRPPLLQQAIEEVQCRLSPDEDGKLQSNWILTQVSHWNTECELLAFLCERSLVLCYYDFVGLSSSRLFRVPLNYIDTVTWGPLSYPRTALKKRAGPALQVQWDKLRAPPSFLSRWNPWADDLPYIILTQHPGATSLSGLQDKCQLEPFKEHLVELVRRAHDRSPLPGRANGPLILQRPICMETFLGLLSMVSSSGQLGYAKSRGGFGF
ncbi:tumor protein p63-regulated gene 1-like protein [Ascaphus truei]|uniref:tumor protein p63-regulated gene 1-like protein n=1 Tax=Ascaphus truei TaxID=8439 RepID=UPI003F5A77E3